jgi:hypothetical protein
MVPVVGVATLECDEHCTAAFGVCVGLAIGAHWWAKVVGKEMG